MKKTIMLMASLLLATTLYATEKKSELSNVYIGVGLAVEAVPKGADDHGIGLVLRVGAPLPQLLKNLGAEVELTTSLVDPEWGKKDINIITLAGYVTYDIRFPDSPLFVHPRAGFILPNLGNSDSVNSRDLGISTGLACLVELNEQMNAYIDYTNLGENINNYTAGVELKF